MNQQPPFPIAPFTMLLVPECRSIDGKTTIDFALLVPFAHNYVRFPDTPNYRYSPRQRRFVSPPIRSPALCQKS